jgi:hypothetical protein
LRGFSQRQGGQRRLRDADRVYLDEAGRSTNAPRSPATIRVAGRHNATRRPTMKTVHLVAALALGAVALAPAAEAAKTKETLVNLTKVGNKLSDAEAACPGTPYFLYAGGFPNDFTGTNEPAYPSPNLLAYIPPGGAIVPYDVPMDNGRFGDSFNLQNTRSVCYAIVQFRVKPTGDIPDNDALVFGHVDSTPAYTVVAQVNDPGALAGIQTYALTPAGLAALSLQTGVNMDKAPSDSILDVYMEDDSEIDFLRVFVWYGPNCTQTNPVSCP